MGMGKQTLTGSSNQPKHSIALSIVIPVYNGANSIPMLIGKLCELTVTDGMEIILVVDGSPDDSLQVCWQLCEQARIPVTVVNLSRNFGEHNAVLAGYSVARGAHIINMDDDLQNPPEEVLKLWQYTKNNNFDVVYTRYQNKEHGSWRNVGSRFTNWCADYLLDKPKGLYLSSFRCINAFTAQQVGLHSGPFPYIDGLILQVTQNIGSLVVEHLPRSAGQSNYTLSRLLRLFLSMFLNFSVIPLRAASVIGATVGAIGFLALLWTLIEAIGGGTPRGWAFMTASLLFLTGTQLLLLGVMGEYIGRMFLTINQRPQFIIRDLHRNAAAISSEA